MNEHDVIDRLALLDQPRTPRPEFARALHDELLREEDDSVVVLELTEPQRARRPRRARVLALVAAAAVLIAGATVAIIAVPGGRRPTTVTVTPGAPTVRAACASFNDQAFAGVSRAQLLGPANVRVFPDKAIARARITTLRDALALFGTDLKRAGVKSHAVLAEVANAEHASSEALTGVAEGAPLAAVADQVKEVEHFLVSVQRELTAIGIASCL
jgi:hypothetical protein